MNCFNKFLVLSTCVCSCLLAGCAYSPEKSEQGQNKDPRDQAERRDSMFHGKEDRVVPIFTKTYDLEEDSSNVDSEN